MRKGRVLNVSLLCVCDGRKLVGESALPLDLQWDLKFVSIPQGTSLVVARAASALTTVYAIGYFTFRVKNLLGLTDTDCVRAVQ